VSQIIYKSIERNKCIYLLPGFIAFGCSMVSPSKSHLNSCLVSERTSEAYRHYLVIFGCDNKSCYAEYDADHTSLCHSFHWCGFPVRAQAILDLYVLAVSVLFEPFLSNSFKYTRVNKDSVQNRFEPNESEVLNHRTGELSLLYKDYLIDLHD
jgi:hypothetical protein